MSPRWIWSDKITNERVVRVGYNHFISNKGKWNNCFSKFSNRVFPPILFSTILESVRKENLAHYFPYDVKLGLLAHSRSFLANQKARNAIVGAENLLKYVSCQQGSLAYLKWAEILFVVANTVFSEPSNQKGPLFWFLSDTFEALHIFAKSISLTDPKLASSVASMIKVFVSDVLSTYISIGCIITVK